jgi:hypothetical protein
MEHRPGHEIRGATFGSQAGFPRQNLPPKAMKRDPSTGDLDQDPVWDLLRQSPSLRPGPNFAANVARAARLEEPARPWWFRLWIPASIGGVLAGSAALVAVVLTLQSTPKSGDPVLVTTAPDSSLADLQENYETEVLLAASDHLADYSDEEIVAMIGF